MKMKGLALLLFIYLSTVSVLSKAQNIDNSDALHSIILFILNDESPITEVIIPEGADTDFTDVSDWNVTATSNRDIANAFDGDPSTR